MRVQNGQVRLAATDLSDHAACPHLTHLNLGAARGQWPAPPINAPDLVVLQQRGLEHERLYVEYLISQGLAVADLRELKSETVAVEATLRAMAEGVEVIVQAALQDGRWFGRPDVLRRTAEGYYEPYDCKLARETKAGTVLQLCHYAALLTVAQGNEPRLIHAVPPSDDWRLDSYPVHQFAAYYRTARRRLERAIAADRETIAEPNAHCEVCRWWTQCNSEWRRQDHLSFTAGISRLQRRQLAEWEVTTMDGLSRLSLPLTQRPRLGSKAGYQRVREQARVQVLGRRLREPVYELLPVEKARGFAKLPAPSDGDIFFDLESDPFVGRTGREYLFGFVARGEDGEWRYERRWSFDAEAEKAAFEWFTDFVTARRQAFTDLHVYHFGAKEPSTLRTLMGRYASREDEIDQMLRGRVLVDLHSIVKQAIRAGVEQYSLKTLEEFHGFGRTVSLDRAKTALRTLEHALELGRVTEISQAERDAVEGYNADDCRSTRSLRDWLELRRAERIEAEGACPRPDPVADDASETVKERQAAVTRVFEALTADVPAEAADRTEEQAARWLLAGLLDWHWRERKVSVWEKFRLAEMDDEDLFHEREAVAGLVFQRALPLEGREKTPVHEYHFPPQEVSLKSDGDLFSRNEKVGTVRSLDAVAGIIQIKKMGRSANSHPTAVYSHKNIKTDDQAASLLRFGELVARAGFPDDGTYRTACDLLFRRSPRLASGGLAGPPDDVTARAVDLATRMDGTVLAIQGPPGAGKTATGGRMIARLVADKKRVGVMANHHVMVKLLEEANLSAGRAGLGQLRCLHKVSDASEDPIPGWLTEETDNAKVVAAIQNGGYHVIAGTAWLWSREDVVGTLDYLFIDPPSDMSLYDVAFQEKAGQLSLANAIAAAPAARNLVLLGDPQQLEQPTKASHPDGAGVSVLEHILAGEATMPADRGLFLDQTWRLHPDICRFTSEVFYDGRLQSRPGLERQRIEGLALGSAGIRFLGVAHEGNQSSSQEEVEYIKQLIDGWLEADVHWVDAAGARTRLRREHILVVAPYNAQVVLLARRLEGIRAGTVDRFQGQQAPIVIYSMTASSPEDAPKGMDFLYSLNRLNVATSRAKALAIIVGSPKLLEPDCRTPRQLRLANALCRYVELAGFAEEAATGTETA